MIFSTWAIVLTIMGLLAAIAGIALSVVNRPQLLTAIVILAFITIISLCLGLTGLSLFGATEPRLLILVIIIGIADILIGAALWNQERHSEFDPTRSRGLLAIGVGGFAIISALILPILPSQFDLPAPALPPTETPTITRTPLPTRTPRITATLTAVPSLTFTPTPIPTLTITPTPEPLTLPTNIEPTDTLTPTLGPCTITVLPNSAGKVNLRRTPSTSGDVLDSVPVGQVLTPTARSSNRAWWKVSYNSHDGWISAGVVSASPACDQLPTATVPSVTLPATATKSGKKP